MRNKKIQGLTYSEIQMLLEKANSDSFLGSIIVLKEKEKEYKKSEFYRISKIPLLVLYQNYAMYAQNKQGMASKIDDIINNIDGEIVVNKIEDILEQLGGSEKVVKLLDSILENFNVDSILKQGEEFKDAVSTLKE